MESPRNNNTEDLMSLTSEYPAVLDATNDIVQELEALTTPLAELTQAAQQCYDDRVEYDLGSINFKRRDQNREDKRREVEERLEIIRDQAASIKEHRDAIKSQLPPHMSAYTNCTVDPWIKELDKRLLLIEQQKLIGIISIIDLAHAEFARAHFDLLSVQDSQARSEMKTSLNKLDTALWDFRDVYECWGIERHRTIDSELMQMTPWDPKHDDFSLGSPTSTDDETSDETDTGASSMTDETAPSISPLSLGSPDLEELGELTLSGTDEYRHDLTFQFDGSNPPGLSRIGNFLGIVGATQVALLLNSAPIQSAFTAYRARSGQPSYIENPEKLKLVLPLFTFSRETLLKWEAHMDGRENGADFSVALFANYVVRFLEGSCDTVDWKPVSSNKDGNIESIEDYEVARRRWAIALQIFRFLEKAFA
ncbi:hypothetical protein E0Z10_g4525 [Xylaria hypoxylon]|uniref:Uncharacterized protein n=1 Tax=Xylaria hypoxylon TaxID=37992 RepID=A0A4Z0Z3R3_9PEZI|nr:hypothetical protein E0Z10_g4525 [Xylaria hypoxylon]